MWLIHKHGARSGSKGARSPGFFTGAQTVSNIQNLIGLARLPGGDALFCYLHFASDGEQNGLFLLLSRCDIGSVRIQTGENNHQSGTENFCQEFFRQRDAEEWSQFNKKFLPRKRLMGKKMRQKMRKNCREFFNTREVDL